MRWISVRANAPAGSFPSATHSLICSTNPSSWFNEMSTVFVDPFAKRLEIRFPGIDMHFSLRDFPLDPDLLDSQGPVREAEVPGIPDQLLEQAVDVHTDGCTSRQTFHGSLLVITDPPSRFDHR